MVSNYKNFHAIIGVGQIKSNLHRKNILKLIKKKNLKIASIYSKKKHTYLKHLKLTKVQLLCTILSLAPIH